MRGSIKNPETQTGRELEHREVDGRPVRDVVLDEKRAPLVREAFYLYASGEYSLMELAAVLEAEGLRTRATKRSPEKSVGFSKLAGILRNPYYMGKVRFKGKTYPGRHERRLSMRRRFRRCKTC